MPPSLHDLESLFRRIQAEIPSPPEQCLALLKLYHDLVLQVSDSSQLQFNTLFARVSYISSRYQLTKPWAYAFQIPRRELHERKLPDVELIAITGACIRYLLSMTHAAATGEEPTPVLKPPSLPRLPASTKRGKLKKKYARVMASVWDRPNRTLQVIDEEEPEEPFTLHYGVEGVNDIFADTLELALDEIGLPLVLGLTDVECTDDRHYIPGYIILLPDILMDITSVAEYHNTGADPSAVNLLNHFLPSKSTIPILAGNVANYFLDELVRDDSLSFDTLFARSFKLYPFEFVHLTDDQLRTVMKQLKTHYENIREVIRQQFPRLGIERTRCMIEPSYFSPVFGIKGRPDLYNEQPDTGTSAIIELKSSKPFRPNTYGLSHAHYHQTLLYELMIRGNQSGSRQKTNYILYSGISDHPLRYAASVESIQKEAIHNRNQLALLDVRLMQLGRQTGRDMLQEIDPSKQESLKGYLKTDAERFFQVYHQLTLPEQRYLKSFAAFIAREHMLARIGSDSQEGTGGLAGLWLDSLEQKEERYQVLKGLHLMSIRQEVRQTLLEFSRSETTNPLANFRAGDIAILYPYLPDDPGDPTQYQLHRATIVELDATQVVVRLRNAQVHLSDLQSVSRWSIEHDLLDSSFRSLYRSLWALMCSGTSQRRLLMGLALPESDGTAGAIQPLIRLSEGQQRIFEEGIRATSLYLLWGPPGTGKTSIMLRSWVAHYFHHTRARVLLLAYTNRAVDEICATLHASGDAIREHYLRIGSRAATGEAFQHHLLDHVIEPMTTRAEIKRKLDETRIIVGTVASVQGKESLFDLIAFDVAIIDEASQLLEPAITGLMCRVKKTILIGDHMQLPAVSAQPDKGNLFSGEDTWATSMGLTDLRMSYFERLYRHYQALGWHQAIGTLHEQGRMHQDIMQYANQYVYGGQLRCADHLRQSRSLRDFFPAEENALLRHRLLYVPSEATLQERYTRTNRQEAAIVLRVLTAWKKMIRETHADWTIGIITPFRAQIAAIHHLAHQWAIDLKDITVDTVERYQGGARDIIILSCAANSQSYLSRMASTNPEGIDRKLNVAVTRAREQFIFTGVETVLRESRAYEALMEMSIRVPPEQIPEVPSLRYHPEA